MFRALCLFCLFVCLSSAAFTQTPNSEAAPPSSVVQVFYVLSGATLTTYNIDPQTLGASPVGTTTLPISVYPWIVTSPNGRFLYYVKNFGVSAKQTLYVYDTNALGVPGSKPVQEASVGQLAGLVVNPAGTFLYSVEIGPENQQLTRQYAVVRSAIDPATGKLSQSVVATTYHLDSDTSGNYCYLSVPGFNPAGTTLYDGILCSGPYGAGYSTYNQRSVNLHTGALGPDKQVYYFNQYGGYANIQFENNFMFAFVVFGNQGPNSSYVDVSQLPNTTPGVNCTSSMWALCGDFSSALADPSGKFVFLQNSEEVTDIGQVNTETGQIVEVNSVPFGVSIFSPNGQIAYGATATPEQIDIAGFDATTGEVKIGGTIQLQPSSDYWVPAERY